MEFSEPKTFVAVRKCAFTYLVTLFCYSSEISLLIFNTQIIYSFVAILIEVFFGQKYYGALLPSVLIIFYVVLTQVIIHERPNGELKKQGKSVSQNFIPISHCVPS